MTKEVAITGSSSKVGFLLKRDAPAAIELCLRLAREKAALEERVEKLEAQLEDYARDEQAREAAEREEAEFQMFALAGEVGERIRWPQN